MFEGTRVGDSERVGGEGGPNLTTYCLPSLISGNWVSVMCPTRPNLPDSRSKMLLRSVSTLSVPLVIYLTVPLVKMRKPEPGLKLGILGVALSDTNP